MLDSTVIESEFDMTDIWIAEVVIDGDLIATAIGLNHQIIAGTGEDHIGRRGPLKTQGISLIGKVGIISYRILAMTFGKDIGI